jgi:geranylgeranyl reductase family protein
MRVKCSFTSLKITILNNSLVHIRNLIEWCVKGETKELPDAFEVGIVGAGVAGSTCAEVLGREGVEVALFDHSHPREKPCGGLIENRVVEEFDIPEELLENEVKWFIVERFKVRVKLFLEPSMFLVSRKSLDYYLLQRTLKNKSVTFFDEEVTYITKSGNCWELKTSEDRSIKVNVLIGADGCPSIVRKHVFNPIPSEFLATTAGYNFQCSSKQIEGKFAKNTVEAYYSREYVKRIGFVWIFPKKTDINVGIGGMDTGEKMKQTLKKFIATHPNGKRLKNLEGQFFSHLVPMVWKENFFRKPCSSHNWALIGDAAGHVNPISGAGIYYAMKGGMLCGSAFLDGDLRLFDRYWQEEYGDELYYGSRTVLRFYSNLGFFSWLQYVLGNFLHRLSTSR